MSKPPIQWPLVGLLSLVGVAMGLLVSLGLTGDSLPGEFLAWTAFALLWVAVVLVRRTPRPFLHVLLASTLGGVLFGATVQALWGSYVDRNPTTFREPSEAAGQDPFSAAVRGMNFLLSIVTGAVWGAIVGGAAAGLARWRARARPAAGGS